jgi:hypothetical protein
MEYEETVAVVRQASGGIGSEAVDRALQATLQTLAERLPRGEARHIVQELPAELKPWIYGSRCGRRRPRGLARNRRARTPRLPAAARPEHRSIALLLPVVPAAVAGAGLAGFSGGLLGLNARTPGMRKQNSPFPTQRESRWPRTRG